MSTTKIRGNWPATPEEPKKKEHQKGDARTVIDVASLKIASDPWKKEDRSRIASKYDDVFSKLNVGECVVCEPHHTGVIKMALGKWLKANGKKGFVRERRSYPTDGKGRVWWLA